MDNCILCDNDIYTYIYIVHPQKGSTGGGAIYFTWLRAGGATNRAGGEIFHHFVW